MPYRSRGNRRNSVQFGVGRSIWSGSPPPAIPEQVLDGIPGFLAWFSFLLIVAGAVLRPRWVVYVAAVLGFYSALRFFFGALANLVGLRRIRKWEAINWVDEYQRLAQPDSLPREHVHHVVIVPNYKEPVAVLSRTLDALALQEGATISMTIVMAMEGAEGTTSHIAAATAAMRRRQAAAAGGAGGAAAAG